MSLSRKILEDVITTTLVKITLKLRGIILIPLLTIYLGVGEYGAYMQAMAIGTILGNVCLLGSDFGIVNYINRSDTPGRLFTSLVVLTTTVSTLVAAVVVALSEPIAVLTLQEARYAPVFTMMALYIVATVVFQLGRACFRAHRRVKYFSAFEAVEAYTLLGGIITGIMVFDTGIAEVFAIALGARVVASVPIYGMILREGWIGPPTTRDVVGCLRFSFGALVNKISQKLLDRTDRVLVGYFLGAEAVGVYSAAYSVSYIMLLYTQPLSASFFPEFSKLWKEDNRETIRAYTNSGVRYLVTIGLPSIAGLALVGSVALDILSTSDVAAAGALPLVLLAAAVLARGIGDIWAQLFYATNKSHVPAVVQGGVAIANLLLNLALIPVLGIVGASLTSLLSFSLSALVMWISLQSTVRIPLPWKKFGQVAVATATMFGLFWFVPVAWFVTVSFGPVVYGVVLVAIGGIERAEVRQVTDRV